MGVTDTEGKREPTMDEKLLAKFLCSRAYPERSFDEWIQPNVQLWRRMTYEAQMILESSWIADHDRRIKAEALKWAANDLPRWVPDRDGINLWLWERAADIEGEVSS